MKSAISGEFVLWGARGHGKVLKSIIESYGAIVVAVVDNDPDALKEVVDATPLLGSKGLQKFLLDRCDGRLNGAIAIGGGRSADRIGILGEFKRLGISAPPIIDQSAVHEAGSVISEGCQLFAGSILGADATLGVACILNHNAVVDHECIVERGVHIAPNATVCGCVHVGEGAFIGASATILPRLRIGANAIVAAGAVVTKDVEPGHTVKGVPASTQTKIQG